MQDPAAPEYGYAMHELPPGRYGFRRWRWELWEGATLLAAGWRLTREHAERALRTNASARSHARLGLRPLRPEQATAVGRFLSPAPVRVELGSVVCLLVPRGQELRG
jgi:hypothetical protein